MNSDAEKVAAFFPLDFHRVLEYLIGIHGESNLLTWLPIMSSVLKLDFYITCRIVQALIDLDALADDVNVVYVNQVGYDLLDAWKNEDNVV